MTHIQKIIQGLKILQHHGATEVYFSHDEIGVECDVDPVEITPALEAYGWTWLEDAWIHF